MHWRTSVFRVMNGVMAALFALAVAVQYNDPDPVRWMAIYGAAMVLSVVAAVTGRVTPAAPILLAVVAIAWAVYWSEDVHGLSSYAHMFDSWEMKNDQVEEARETSGLLIVVAWMVVLAAYPAIERRRWSRSHGT
jgi:hypothetical protein